MKVSIQIPTFNQEKFITKAIESALLQNYPELEIIVLDDFSTDNTYQIANSFIDARLKVFRNDKNIGRVKNYNRLLYEFVSGDWVVNLDGDDYFTDPDFISAGIAEIKKGENIVFYQAAIIGRSQLPDFVFKHKLLGNNTKQVFDGKTYFINFNKNEFFSHLSTIYNVAKAKDIGFYSYDTLIADAESMLKLALHGNVILANKLVGVWNIHSNNESQSILTKNSSTIDAFKQLQQYAEPYIGKNAAVKWFKDATNTNTGSYMEELAKKDFKEFLVRSVKETYFTKRLLILMIKKVLGRI